MNPPISVVHLITELDAGGTQMNLFRLLTHLDRRRFASRVICLYNGDKVVARRIRELGIPVDDLNMHAPWRLDALVRLYKRLLRERPVILHGWLFHANIPGRILGRLARTPVIVTSRQNIDIGGTWRDQATRWTRFLDDAVVAVCESARQAEIRKAGADPDKVMTIYSGIEPFSPPSAEIISRLRSEFSLPQDAPVVICVSRLHPQKGHDDLLAAWDRIASAHPGARLLIVGDGERRAALEKQARGKDRLHFVGQRNDVPNLLALSRLLVLPSLWEGLPGVLLEAMSAGLPVVATAVGGTPELVTDGENGLLVPSHDPEAFAGAVLSLLHQPDRAAQMGENGRRRVAADFSMDRMAARTMQLYERLVHEKQGRKI